MDDAIGAYGIERRLGAGGMAEVFLARRRGPEGFAKKVALKRVLPAFNHDPDFVRLFQDEARLAAHLDHPHIASIHDFGVSDGSWYMAMEYVDGVDLQTLLTGLKAMQQPMPIEFGLLLAVDLASALLYAHELTIDERPATIVHRDVSPSNVLIDLHGNIKLADFGIARATTHGHHTRTGIIKGKVPYMPPEQALGETFDHRVDLFALGVVLYEALAGKRPFHGATELDTLQRICKGAHAPLAEVAPQVPPPLADVVERLIRSDPGQRFASASEVHDALAASPPPTNARRLLGSLVRRVRALAAPRSEPTVQLELGGEGEVRAPIEAPETKIAEAPIAQEVPMIVEPARSEGIAPSAIAIAHEGSEPEPRSESDIVWDLQPVARPQGRDRLVVAAITLALVLALGTAGLVALMVLDVGGDAVAAPIAVVEAPVDRERARNDPGVMETATGSPPALREGLGEGGRGVATASRPDLELYAPPPAPPAMREASLPPTDTRARRGRVRVFAIPMGEVSIDGRRYGTAPITASLAAGRHTVVVTNGEPSQRVAIDLEPGENERVVVRFVP